MVTLTEVAALIPTLRGRLGSGDGAEGAQATLMRMSDADALSVLGDTAAVGRLVEQIQVAAAGVIARRSTREQGHAGLSASRGAAVRTRR